MSVHGSFVAGPAFGRGFIFRSSNADAVEGSSLIRRNGSGPPTSASPANIGAGNNEDQLNPGPGHMPSAVDTQRAGSG